MLGAAQQLRSMDARFLTLQVRNAQVDQDMRLLGSLQVGTKAAPSACHIDGSVIAQELQVGVATIERSSLGQCKVREDQQVAGELKLGTPAEASRLAVYGNMACSGSAYVANLIVGDRGSQRTPGALGASCSVHGRMSSVTASIEAELQAAQLIAIEQLVSPRLLITATPASWAVEWKRTLPGARVSFSDESLHTIVLHVDLPPGRQSVELVLRKPMRHASVLPSACYAHLPAEAERRLFSPIFLCDSPRTNEIQLAFSTEEIPREHTASVVVTLTYLSSNPSNPSNHRNPSN
jgi:hypothetical protein